MSSKIYSLSEVIGQGSIVKWFSSIIQRDRMPQVIMLAGPAGIGKTSIAKVAACEIAYMNYPMKLDDAKKSIIGEDKSTDAVRLYNMSNLKSQDAVQSVKSDLSVGFSSTGRKVIIMDEAHGMSEEAQDSLLTVFESLPLHVYVIVCTTELESFREAFLSRCLLRRLSNLSESEMRSLLKKRIEDNQLKFTLSLPMVLSLVINYAGREPRRALNLLDSFEPNSIVATEELESFVNVYEGAQLVSLIDNLYSGNILNGLSIIKDIDISSTFVATLLEVLSISQGNSATIIRKDGVLRLRELVNQYGLKNLLGFCIDVTTCTRLSRNKLSGYFLRWCRDTERIFEPPKKYTAEEVALQDLSIMNNMIEHQEVFAETTKESGVQVMSLEQLLANSEVLND